MAVEVKDILREDLAEMDSVGVVKEVTVVILPAEVEMVKH